VEVSVDKPKTYNVKEVADRVGVTDRTLRRWWHTGKIPEPSRDRNNRPAFTDDTLRAILHYAFQLKPAPGHQRPARQHARRTA
jgi:hypothetical protein